MPTRPNRPIRRLAQGLSLCAAAWLAAPAAADSLQRGDFPASQNITIIGVEDGKLKYRTAAAGDREVPLEEVKSIEITAVPQFGAGLKAFQDGQLRQAQRAFNDVWAARKDNDDWIRHYAGYYLTQIYDQRKQPVEAAQVFAALASSEADLYFLGKPPEASLAEADDDQKRRIADEIKAVFEKSNGERREKLETFLRKIIGDEPINVNPNPGPGARDGGNEELAKLKAESKLTLPKPVWQVLARKNEPKDKWNGLKQLAQGQYKGSVETMKPWLNNPGDLPVKLFIYGKAQLALADATQDTEEKDNLYRDAGLTFMRIVVHFNRQGQPHPLVAPAQLEVAYIHKQIGRDEIYNRILFGGEGGGGLHLVINDAKDYPEYRKRYYEIIGEEVPADE